MNIDTRRGECFQELVTVGNSSVPQWTLMTVTASQGGTNTSQSGYAYVPKAPEAFQAELSATNNAVMRSSVWGLDLFGSEQGAGGVGGLLLEMPAGTNTVCVAYDGNGNVMGLVDATAGTAVAQNEYGPFGEGIRLSGAGAAGNPFRFSTKYQDAETDLLYYVTTASDATTRAPGGGYQGTRSGNVAA